MESIKQKIKRFLLKEKYSGYYYIAGLASLVIAIFLLVAKILSKMLSIFSFNWSTDWKMIGIIFAASAVWFFIFQKVKRPKALGFIFLWFATTLFVNKILGILNWEVNGGIIIAILTFGAVSLYVGETRRLRLETGKTNRLSYLPGLIL